MNETSEFILRLLELIFSNVFIIFFLFLFILPMIARRGRYAALTQLFSKLQRKRKSRIITLVHRLEPMGFLGIARFGYIDLNDAEEIIEAIRTTPKDQPLEVMLHTPGGLVLAAVQIARALKAHPGPTRVYVPHFAMSGGTMIALSADEIVMSDHAIMGPVDPQIDGIPAASILRVREQKSADATADETLILADVSEMAIEQVKAAARELLSGTVSDNAANAIAEQLSTGRWTHDYPIYATEAKAMGLNVSTDMPQDFMELMGLFPNTLASRSGVRYLAQRVFGGLFGGNRKQAPMSAYAPQLGGAYGGAPMRPTYSGGHGPAPSLDHAAGLGDDGLSLGRGPRQVSFGPWNPEDLARRGQTTPVMRGHKSRPSRFYQHR